MRLIFFFITFAVVGVAHEVLWVGLLDFIKGRNPRLKGRSTLWMFPIYGCVLFIVMLVHWVYGNYPWWFRGIMYAALLLIWEYMSGYTVRKLVGVAPWDYAKATEDGMGSKKKFHYNGLVCLEYVPIWFVEGLLAEWFYLFLQAHVVF